MEIESRVINLVIRCHLHEESGDVRGDKFLRGGHRNSVIKGSKGVIAHKLLIKGARFGERSVEIIPILSKLENFGHPNGEQLWIRKFTGGQVDIEQEARGDHHLVAPGEIRHGGQW